MLLHLPLEAPDVEADLPGAAIEICALQLSVGLEEAVVHLPEAPLGSGRLRLLRGRLGVGVDPGEREGPEHEAGSVAEAPPQPPTTE